MIRRRRPKREIEFSFDSFLDVVANVVGIILRLILVAWIAGRGYKGVVPTPLVPPPALPEPASLPNPTDPRESLMGAERDRIARAQQAATRTAQQSEAQEAASAALVRQLEAVHRSREALQARQFAAQQVVKKDQAAAHSVSATLDEIRSRTAKVLAEAERMKKLPPMRKTLRYHTPVSAEVQTEEVMFECKQGRVTLIDTQALVNRARAQAEQRSGELKSSWEFKGQTPAVGAYRIRFTVSRERSALDGPSGQPLGDGFRYGLSAWELMPVIMDRGEPSARALAEGSDFRRVVDALDPKQTVVTLWVYPDSFSLYRDLRDYLHKRDVVVAGRPLPDGIAIGSSRDGTASRGQ